MGPKTEAINFRVETGVADRLRAVAEQNRRGVSDELRAGVEIYLLLVQMTNLRANDRLDPLRALEYERAIKDEIGRIFLVALSADAENAFEEDLGVEYPRDTFREIAIPFDKLLDWVVNGASAGQGSNEELVAEARKWSDSSPVIGSQDLPPADRLRSWAGALEATNDQTALLSRVQQALRVLMG